MRTEADVLQLEHVMVCLGHTPCRVGAYSWRCQVCYGICFMNGQGERVMYVQGERGWQSCGSRS